METYERTHPLGSLVGGVDGNSLLLKDGQPIHLNKAFGQNLCVDRPLGYALIGDLCEEIDLLRRLLKQALKSEHVPIVDSNEFHRNTASISHKIGSDIESVRAVVQPLLEQLVAEMFAPRPPKKEGRRKTHHRRGSAPHAEMREMRIELTHDEDMR